MSSYTGYGGPPRGGSRATPMWKGHIGGENERRRCGVVRRTSQNIYTNLWMAMFCVSSWPKTNEVVHVGAMKHKWVFHYDVMDENKMYASKLIATKLRKSFYNLKRTNYWKTKVWIWSKTFQRKGSVRLQLWWREALSNDRKTAGKIVERRLTPVRDFATMEVLLQTIECILQNSGSKVILFEM